MTYLQILYKNLGLLAAWLKVEKTFLIGNIYYERKKSKKLHYHLLIEIHKVVSEHLKLYSSNVVLNLSTFETVFVNRCFPSISPGDQHT